MTVRKRENMSKTIPPGPRRPPFKSGKPGLVESDYEATQETTALLKILALGNREVEMGEVKRVIGVARRMRAKNTGT